MPQMGIETTTWHDQRPTHNVKPRVILAAQHDEDVAWKARDAALDDLMTARKGASFYDLELAVEVYDRANLAWELANEILVRVQKECNKNG